MSAGTVPSNGRPPITESRLRRRVLESIEVWVGGRPTPESEHHAVIELESLGTQVIPILIDLLVDDQRRRRLVAAWMLYRWIDYDAKLIGDQAVHERLGEVVLEGVQQDNPDDRALACMAVAFCPAPPSVLAVLPALIEQRADRRVRVLAAAALLTGVRSVSSGAKRPKELSTAREASTPAINVAMLMDVLLTAIREEKVPAYASVAAHALAELALRSDEARQATSEVLSRASPLVQRWALTGLYRMGRRAELFATEIAAMTNNSALPDEVRGVAIIAFTAISSSDSDRIELLLTHVACGEPAVVRAIAEAFSLLHICPPEALDHFIAYCQSEDTELRFAAYRGIAAAGKASGKAIPVLLNRLGTETERRLAVALSDALAASEPAAVFPLAEVIADGDQLKCPAAQLALSRMGSDAFVEITRALAIAADQHVRDALREALRAIGARGGGIVSPLEELVESIRSDQCAFAVMHAVSSIGTLRDEAVPTIVACMKYGTADLQEYALEVLRAIGAPARPAIERELKAVPAGPVRRVLQSALNALEVETQSHSLSHQSSARSGSHRDPQLWRCRLVNSDKLLRQFLYVAGLMERDESKSLSRIALVLQRCQRKGVVPDDIGVSKASLSPALAEVEKRLRGQALFTYSDGRQGGLTDHGANFLEEVKLYYGCRDNR